MKTCPNCNKELSDDCKFCDVCGTAAVEIVNEQPSQEQSMPVNEQPINVQYNQEQPMQAQQFNEQPIQGQPTNKNKKKLPKKAIIFGSIGVAVAAIIVVLIVLLSGGKGKQEKNYALYIKEGALFYSDLKANSKPLEITSELAGDSFSEDDLYDIGSNFERYGYVRVSSSGKYIFYPENIERNYYESTVYDLYYRDITNAKAEPKKIDSDIDFYIISENDAIITYVKDSGDLFQYNMKNDSKEKVEEDVEDADVSKDGNKIIYSLYDGIYLYTNGESEKLAGEGYELEHISEDFNTIYYTRENTLYKHVIGKDRVEIASDVDYVIEYYEDGKIYYYKTESEEVSVSDYVIDDMKDADANITEPEWPDYPDYPSYPYSWNYDTYEEYEAAYNQYLIEYEEVKAQYDAAVDKYNEDYELYQDKRDRDYIREYLEDETIDLYVNDLCFYNGKEEIVISDMFISYDYTESSEKPVIAFSAYKKQDIEKVKLSEIESVYSVSSDIRDTLTEELETYIAVEGKAYALEHNTDTNCFYFNSTGTIAYYLYDEEEHDEIIEGDLYRVSISKDGIGKAELYDNDVYSTYRNTFINDKDFMYIKDYDYDNDLFDLYINKELVEYDVYDMDIYEKQDKLFYRTGDEESYTLYLYENGKSTKIDDDVSMFTLLPDGRILYLRDYSFNYYTGELMEWVKGKTRKIDNDVQCVVRYVY